ncbi:hypothetical protein L9F63_021316, partial [Diploptera punctata]
APSSALLAYHNSIEGNSCVLSNASQIEVILKLQLIMEKLFNSFVRSGNIIIFSI